MSEGAETKVVVVIQDASRDVSWSAVRGVLHCLQLKPGDELILLGVLHQVNNPMGYKSKVDSSSILASNSKIVEEEVARKSEQYHENGDRKQLNKQCQMEKIKFRILVKAGPSPKMVALEAAISLRATWVILDRQMKKDRKYFMENLSCGVSRMKRDNSIEELRGPKGTETTKLAPEKTSSSTGPYFSYGEMIPGARVSAKKSPPKTNYGKEQGSEGGGLPPWGNYHRSGPPPISSSSEQTCSSTLSNSSLGNTESSSFSFNEAKTSPLNFQTKENTTTTTEQETAGEQSPFSYPESTERTQTEASDIGSPNEQQKQSISDGEEFENSICSVCNNKRPKVGWKRDFTYQELYEATEGFSPKNFLSEGGFGCVYKGVLKNGLKVAVKQHKDASFQGEKEFKSEVSVLSRARHQNVVMLLGSCSEGSHRLLVYEYVCHGSLDQHISKYTRRPLNWDKRIKIAMGAAKGLEYLHANNIIHRDMRPNNILVTHDYESLLGDFGLARAQYDDVEHSSETRVVGTLGYVAPEYAECGIVSTKTDVYSFGVVLLQLITGLKTTDKKLGGKSLVGWARPLLKEKNYGDLIDQRIEETHDVHQLFWMVRVVEKCLNKDPTKRNTMEKVVETLKYIIEGNTTSIRDFSPAQSGSANSRTGSSTTDVSARRSSVSTSPLLSPANGRTPEKKKGTSYNEMVI